MANGAAGCGWEYRGNLRSTGYVCPKLNKTRDGFYCRQYSEHLGWKECYEGENLDVVIKHPFRYKQCTGKK